MYLNQVNKKYIVHIIVDPWYWEKNSNNMSEWGFKQLIYKSFNQNKLFSYYVSSVTVIKSYTYLNDFLLQNNISCGFYA